MTKQDAPENSSAASFGQPDKSSNPGDWHACSYRSDAFLFFDSRRRNKKLEKADGSFNTGAEIIAAVSHMDFCFYYYIEAWC